MNHPTPYLIKSVLAPSRSLPEFLGHGALPLRRGAR